MTEYMTEYESIVLATYIVAREHWLFDISIDILKLQRVKTKKRYKVRNGPDCNCTSFTVKIVSEGFYRRNQDRSLTLCGGDNWGDTGGDSVVSVKAMCCGCELNFPITHGVMFELIPVLKLKSFAFKVKKRMEKIIERRRAATVIQRAYLNHLYNPKHSFVFKFVKEACDEFNREIIIQ